MTKANAPRLRLDHVGIAVKNLPEAMERYSKLLGKPASAIEDVPSEKVRVSFFELEGCFVETGSAVIFKRLIKEACHKTDQTSIPSFRLPSSLMRSGVQRGSKTS